MKTLTVILEKKITIEKKEITFTAEIAQYETKRDGKFITIDTEDMGNEFLANFRRRNKNISMVQAVGIVKSQGYSECNKIA